MGGRVIVAEQVGGGVEVLLGAVRDPDYGAVVVAGVGGGTAEALDLAAATLAPLDAAGAERLVRAVPALARLVGDPIPTALLHAIVSLGDLIAAHPEIVEIDVNPLLVQPGAVVALDGLIVLGGALMSDPLLVERRGPAAWLTLNRPDKMNALNAELLAGLEAALDEVVADDDVKVVVLTGAGERAFSAGFDLEAAAADSLGHAAEQWHEHLEYDVAVTMRLWSFPKPTIAAVRGHCLAGGCELAMACDMVVGGESGRFGEPEIRFGSGPVTLLMPFVLGQKRTAELLFTGDVISAVEAERAGLVNRVVPDAELEATVDALVRKIAPTPLAVLRLTKLALVRAQEAMGLRQAVGANLDLSAMVNATDGPEQREFWEIVRRDGLRAGLAWRDSRYGESLS